MKLFLFTGAWLGFFFTHGQGITNVRTFQEDDKIVIYYDILSLNPNKTLFITAEKSTDGGKTFGTRLTEATGDINKNVKVGSQKQIVWDAKKEGFISNSFVFRINGFDLVQDQDFKSLTIQIADLNKIEFRLNSVIRQLDAIEVFALIENISDTRPTQIALQGIKFTDNLGKVYTDFSTVHANFSNVQDRIITLGKGERKQFNFSLKNVSLDAIYFSEVQMTVSGSLYVLKNVVIN